MVFIDGPEISDTQEEEEEQDRKFEASLSY